MKNFVIALLFLLATTTLFAKDKSLITVQIIARQSSESQYDYVTTLGNGSQVTGGTFSVTGATLTLLLPDGREAVVNCAWKFKENFAGPIGNRRSCHVPLTNEVQMETHGDGAKLYWSVSLDGKKTQSETYKILGVFNSK
jgi:hypothetical protein